MAKRLCFGKRHTHNGRKHRDSTLKMLIEEE